eukprot:g47514.t1
MDDVLRRTVAAVPPYEIRQKPALHEAPSREFVRFYRCLGDAERPVFLAKLAADYGTDHGMVSEVCGRLKEAQSRDLGTLLKAEDRLRYSLTPRYKFLISHICRLEGGVKFIVDLRADILQCLQSKTADTPQIRESFILSSLLPRRIPLLIWPHEVFKVMPAKMCHIVPAWLPSLVMVISNPAFLWASRVVAQTGHAAILAMPVPSVALLDHSCNSPLDPFEISTSFLRYGGPKLPTIFQ